VPALPAAPGKTAIEMFEAVRNGEIKLLWIVCTNPAQSIPSQSLLREALARAELVVLQEAYADTETAPYADVVLPATTWGEKDGTMTNSERRVSRVRAAVVAPGEARHDWRIAADFSRRLQARQDCGAPELLPYIDAEQIFDEHRGLTRGRDLDITGLTYALIDAHGPQQWPCASGARQGRARLYEDGVFPTPGGRARFVATPYRPVAEAVDARYPFRLITARLRDQWHGMSRSGRAAQSYGHGGEPAIALHPADLARRRIEAGDLVHVESRRGRVTLAVEASDALLPGTASLPMHWGSRLLGGRDAGGINAVTLSACDDTSHQPELKHCAVRITPARLPHRLVAYAYADDADALRLLERAAALLERCAYAHCMLVQGTDAGVLLRAAEESAFEPALLDELDVVFGMGGTDTLRYDDARRNVSRRVRVSGERVVATRLSGDLSAEAWLRNLFLRGTSVADMRRLLLAPNAPAGPVRGKALCSCWNVTESDVIGFLSSYEGGDAFGDVRQALKCGTQCGSCVPELKQLIATRKEAA